MCVACFLDIDGNGHVSMDELQELFKAANLSLPGFRIREMTATLMEKGDTNRDGVITFPEFQRVMMDFEWIMIANLQ